MNENKVSLLWAVRQFSNATAAANVRLCSEYITNAKKLTQQMEDSGLPEAALLPPPLVITSAKIKFSAYVSREDTSQDGEIMLEFDKPANFHSEIDLKPYGSDSPQNSKYIINDTEAGESTDDTTPTIEHKVEHYADSAGAKETGFADDDAAGEVADFIGDSKNIDAEGVFVGFEDNTAIDEDGEAVEEIEDDVDSGNEDAAGNIPESEFVGYNGGLDSEYVDLSGDFVDAENAGEPNHSEHNGGNKSQICPHCHFNYETGVNKENNL